MALDRVLAVNKLTVQNATVIRSEAYTRQILSGRSNVSRRCCPLAARWTACLTKGDHNGTGGNLDIAANALASTANFLRAHGWSAATGYQPGEANFGAIQAWNAAPVYQRAIALIGQRIDGGVGTSGRR